MMRTLLLGLIQAYRWFLSPWLGSACRFEPTCSLYALGALRQHGAAGGSYLVIHRISRCHPWCAGGHDPVPATLFKSSWFKRPSTPSSSIETTSL